MATRFYLPASGTTAPSVSPAFDASWESTASAFRALLEREKYAAALASSGVAEAVNNTSYDVLIAQYVSAPLSGNQTISGAIKGIIRAQESNVAADMRAQCVIRVLSNDGSTVRGTLIASNAGALASEFATTLTNRKFPLGWTGSGETPTSVNALDTDRIVIEIGYRSHEASATSRTGTFSLGNVRDGTDCAEDETSTTENVPWIEFADTLVFTTASPTARITQVPRLVAIEPSSPVARVTQLVRLVAIATGEPEAGGAKTRSFGWIIG